MNIDLSTIPKMNVELNPIAKMNNISGWKQVEVREYNEKLVPLSKYDKIFIIKPMFFLIGMKGAIGECYVRETVAELLIKASNSLPKGYKFLIHDTWRPLEIQKELFDYHLEEIRKDNPETSEQQLIEMTECYCALPSYDNTKPSPHNTGGAMDLTIVDETGKELQMEAAPYTEESSTRFYEKKEDRGEKLLSKELVYRDNRRLLYNILVKEGFSNYPYEWWHFDYGNQFWGKMTGNIAMYGMIKP